MRRASIRRRKPAVSNDEGDVAEKTALLRFTYQEVLDATKHQDDKIGRLLTVLAFLTAGALALANLESGKKLAAVFEVSPFTLPLGMFSITAFLLTIFLTVVLLVTSLATPLRLPGGRRNPAYNKVIDSKTSSQIYFSEIAKISLDEWEDKWTEEVIELKSARLNSFIHETHNLSLRATTKYDRTSEAVSVFSVALLGFALAIAFTYLATTSVHAGTSADPVVITSNGRILIAIVLAAYTFVQLLTRLRYSYQAVDEGAGSEKQRRTTRCETTLVVSLPAVIAISVGFSHWPYFPIAIGLLFAAGLISLAAIIIPLKFSNEKRSIVLSDVLLTALVIGDLTVTTYGLLNDRYGFQLIASVAVSALLVLLGAFTPTSIVRSFRRKYKERQAVVKPSN